MVEFSELTRQLQKEVISLHKKSERIERGLFLAEGLKICNELFNNDKYKPEFIVIPGNVNDNAMETALKFYNSNIDVYKINRKIFERLCDVQTAQDILAVVNFSEQNILGTEPFIALDGVSDPGNVGTIIRSAEWFGFKQILLGEGCADAFNPKTVRSSMGSIFRMNVIDTGNLRDFIINNFPEHTIYGTFTDAKTNLQECEFQYKSGIILGNESRGISEEVQKIINKKIKILGIADTDSLNVAVAAGIIFYQISQNINNYIS